MIPNILRIYNKFAWKDIIRINQNFEQKILRILDQLKNSKNEDLNETTIYNQFQLKDEIATNQNLYNINED